MTQFHIRIRASILLCWLLLFGGNGAVGGESSSEEALQGSPPVPRNARKWLLWWNDSQKHQEQLLRDAPTTPTSKTKKKEKKKINARQKIANCRHLATTTTDNNHNNSKLARALKRLSLRHVSSRDMNLAYGMGVAASLSYWDFHKKALPEDKTRLQIVSYRNGFAEPLRRRRGHRRAQAVRFVLSSVRLALDQSQPWLSLLPIDNRRTIRQQRKQQQQNTSSSQAAAATATAPNSAATENESTRSYRGKLFPNGPTSSHHNIQLEYSFYNWYEPTPLGNYHDTDLLIATSNGGQNLILAFAGTASATDTVTNLQTFESAQHSGFFHNRTLQGSIHRGFLNAYSRVERGMALKICQDHDCQIETSTPLYQRYGHCAAESVNPEAATSSPTEESAATAEEKQSSYSNNATETTTWKRGPCKVKNRKLMTILRELVIDYLSAGKSVHLTGHSLGGSIATLHALDIIINFPSVPVAKLELWTFGGAQVADDAFLNSALVVAPRLKRFLQEDSIMGNLHNRKKDAHGGAAAARSSMLQSSRSQFHRFVTVSDDCKVDFVSTVAQKTLAPDNQRNIHGKTARKLGGIRGSSVVHLTDPHYLLTPDQYDVYDDQTRYRADSVGTSGKLEKKKKTQEQREEQLLNDGAEMASPTSHAPPQNSNKQQSPTRSTLSAHSTSNYLKGISRESRDHPVSTDLPVEVRRWLGEIMV